MKEEFFSKFIDYNKKLEEILEGKDFSEEVKNLLLSMLYKIEIAYNDYATVKVNVPSKTDFIENVLDMISECKKIEIVKKSSEEGIKFEKNNIRFRTDKLAYTVKTYENEKDILEAIIDLNSINIYLPEKYNLIRIAVPEMINEGNKSGDVEIIRDFNAWSWNILKDEISDLYSNIVYQNLIILLGYDVLQEIFNMDDIQDTLQILISNLEVEYNKQKVEEFISLLYKISIDVCTNKNKSERNRLLDEKTFLQAEYEEITNKTQYLSKITDIKKKNHVEIGKIDTILNSKELLLKEYLKRNEKLPKYNKLFSITHLQEILNKQRRKLLEEIENCNKKLEPQNYIKNKEKLEEQLYLLENIAKTKISKIIIEENIIKLQKLFLGFFEEKIDKVQEKEEMIEAVYLVRYYKFIPLEKKSIKEIKSLSKFIDNIENKILFKLWEQKNINKLIPQNELNIKIVKNIFDTKIINLSNIQIKVKKQEGKITVELYDGETLEKTVEIETKENEKIDIKLNKSIKIFN